VINLIKRLAALYEDGSLTGYQVMMDGLRILDPDDPAVVLSELPEEILDEMLDYARGYDSRRPHSSAFPAPAEDQVRAAERWIRARRTESPDPSIDDVTG
jgi:hypothetical protein